MSSLERYRVSFSPFERYYDISKTRFAYGATGSSFEAASK